MNLHEAHRELHKWLNEEQLKPIDREALATVLWAVAATAQAPVQPAELCFCDENNIGEPDVSCGDCPTRDYKQAQPEQEQHRQPLTMAEISSMDCRVTFDEHHRVVRMTEAAHGIGNKT